MNILKVGLIALDIVNVACEMGAVVYYNNQNHHVRGKAQKIFERLYTIVGVANAIFAVNYLAQVIIFHFTKRAIRILPLSVMSTVPLVILGMRLSVTVAGYMAVRNHRTHKTTLYSTMSNSLAATRMAFSVFGFNQRGVDIICNMSLVGELAYRILFHVAK